MTEQRPRVILRRRLLGFLLVPLLTVFLLSMVIDYRIVFRPTMQSYDEALIDNAFALASRIRTKGPDTVVDLPAAAEAVLRSNTVDIEFFAIRGPRGRLLAGDADLHPTAVNARIKPHLSEDVIRGYKVRKATYQLDTTNGTVTVVVAATTRKRESAESRILAAMLLPNLTLIALTLVLVYVGVRSGLAPLTLLSKDIARRSPHDLSPLPKVDIPGEAEPLVQAMDSLIMDLRTAALAQQAFLANAAHQLKTPLAGLQTQLELAAAELPEQSRHRILQLQEATTRLGHMTHQLLALARSAPEAAAAIQTSPFDLSTLLEENASRWFDQAMAKGIDLGFEPERAPTEGAPWLIRELLANLIDNALQYTPSGGHVTARSGLDEQGRPFLEVDDDGPGIPVHERDKVLERFYRPDGSPGTGTGLGLAIVKEVADRHGGNVTLREGSTGRGLAIRVTFPQGGLA